MALNFESYQIFPREHNRKITDLRPKSVWNRIPDTRRDDLIEFALEHEALTTRELAVKYTDEKRYFVSESSAYRILKAADLITAPDYVVIKAADEFKDKTTSINEMWQTDFTYFKIIGWGWYYLSTILDDYRRYIIAWKLCANMRAEDVTDTIELALTASGCNQAVVRVAVVTRMAWIKRQQAKFDTQKRQSERSYVSGESHFFFGQRYRLNTIDGAPAGRVHIRNSRTLDLYVRSGSDQAIRDRVFQDWYRRELRAYAAPLMAAWADASGIPVPRWGIKRMKTKWGTCNIEAKRVWINLELVKKPPQCLEYVVVHELAHFFERNPTDRFVALLDQKLPQWRLIRDELNAAPLAHEEWDW